MYSSVPLAAPLMLDVRRTALWLPGNWKYDSFMGAIQRWKQSTRKLKKETYALYLAAWHPRTPWYAKLFIICVAGYALSPIDLIPDFIPVLGYLDDLLIVPLGIRLALKLVPDDVLEECRQRAETEMGGEKPKSWAAAVVIVTIWIISLGLVGAWIYIRVHGE